MNLSYKIIVARFNENIDWIDNIGSIANHCIIYNKGFSLNKKYPIIDIPNIPIYAREGTSILKYIIDNYNDLPDYLFFIQADPFDHCFNFLDVFTYMIQNIEKLKPYQPMTFGWSIDKKIPPIENILYDNRNYINDYKIYMQYSNYALQPLNYYDVGLQDILHKFKEYNKIDHDNIINFLYKRLNLTNKINPNYIIFNYGSMFGVKKQNILNNSLKFYIDLNTFNEEHETHIFMLERMWYSIFN
jgi:hypothetical protein